MLTSGLKAHIDTRVHYNWFRETAVGMETLVEGVKTATQTVP